MSEATYRMQIADELIAMSGTPYVGNPASCASGGIAFESDAAKLDTAVTTARSGFRAWTTKPISERHAAPKCLSPFAPFGGPRQSGRGAEQGEEG
jgi:acyl-CoA reductase-like NAD-dependent aldehyde dehydrogenase